MNDLKNCFDRVVLINLKRRPDRLASVRARLAEVRWPLREPVLFEAVDGSVVPQPVGWQMGGGTWGCLQSHRQVLERAIMDGVRSLLVLEDDVTIPGPQAEGGDVTQQLARFMGIAPPDWDQLMLGGQHIEPAQSVGPGVVKCVNCQRTHAYAIRGRMLRDLYAIWCSSRSTTHCDHIMGPVQGRYNVYAPAPFIFGQSRSRSDINGKENAAKSWNPPTGREIVLLLRCPQPVVAALRDWGIHTGYDRDPHTDIDRGLSKVFVVGPRDPPGHERRKLQKWIQDLQWECISEEGLVLGAWHPKLTADAIREVWTGGRVIEVTAERLEDAVAQIKESHPIERRPMPSREWIILLRADRQTAGQLRGIGWHMGNWRDPVTDVDNGLREWAAAGRPCDRLAEIIRVLSHEAEGIRGGIACLWHSDLTAELVAEATDLRVADIEATDATAAIERWTKLREEAASAPDQP